MSAGRIHQTLSPKAQSALKVKEIDSFQNEMLAITDVDQAHLVMLVRAEIVQQGQAAALLRGIEELRRQRFAPLLQESAPRGTYLMYENYLISNLGAEVGGVLHTARSRNDLNATVLLLRLRKEIAGVCYEVIRLLVSLLVRAKRFARLFMPIYTHFQVAQPGSFGHYLLAVAEGAQRSLCFMLHLLESDVSTCPLGAGAAGGTSLSIDQALTAKLLGFRRHSRNSLDAVASRDHACRFLAELTIVGALMSRVSTDFQLWTTSEFNFFELPDSLVGSSSMMPQKRNPYLLEHIQGKSAHALAGFVSSITSIHAKPLTNNIAANTESMSQLWNVAEQTKSAIVLLNLIIRGLVPNEPAMLGRASGVFMEATEAANQLQRVGVPFRRAHEIIGQVIAAIVAVKAEPSPDSICRYLVDKGYSIGLEGLDPQSLLAANRYGGGPGGDVVEEGVSALSLILKVDSGKLFALKTDWSRAASELDAAVRELMT